MRALVFVSKTTGFDCLKWLLANCPDDDYTIFLGEADKQLIADFLTSNGVPFYDLVETDPMTVLTAGDAYDWLINIWGSYIFKEPLLAKVKNSVNLHPSLLPYGRGRDPVVWAIRDQAPAGATLHEITVGIDAGAIWTQVEVPYIFPVSGEQLYAKVERASVELFTAQWRNLRDGKLSARPQGRPELPTRKRKDLLSDRVIKDEDRAVILKLLAHDLGKSNYTAILNAEGKSYSVTLNIRELK